MWMQYESNNTCQDKSYLGDVFSSQSENSRAPSRTAETPQVQVFLPFWGEKHTQRAKWAAQVRESLAHVTAEVKIPNFPPPSLITCLPEAMRLYEQQ